MAIRRDWYRRNGIDRFDGRFARLEYAYFVTWAGREAGGKREPEADLALRAGAESADRAEVRVRRGCLGPDNLNPSNRAGKPGTRSEGTP